MSRMTPACRPACAHAAAARAAPPTRRSACVRLPATTWLLWLRSSVESMSVESTPLLSLAPGSSSRRGTGLGAWRRCSVACTHADWRHADCLLHGTRCRALSRGRRGQPCGTGGARRTRHAARAHAARELGWLHSSPRPVGHGACGGQDRRAAVREEQGGAERGGGAGTGPYGRGACRGQAGPGKPACLSWAGRPGVCKQASGQKPLPPVWASLSWASRPAGPCAARAMDRCACVASRLVPRTGGCAAWLLY